MEALREKGVNPFGQRFERTHHAKDILDNAEALIASGQEVVIAGRLMAKAGPGESRLCQCAGLERKYSDLFPFGCSR